MPFRFDAAEGAGGVSRGVGPCRGALPARSLARSASTKSRRLSFCPPAIRDLCCAFPAPAFSRSARMVELSCSAVASRRQPCRRRKAPMHLAFARSPGTHVRRGTLAPAIPRMRGFSLVLRMTSEIACRMSFASAFSRCANGRTGSSILRGQAFFGLVAAAIRRFERGATMNFEATSATVMAMAATGSIPRSRPRRRRAKAGKSG